MPKRAQSRAVAYTYDEPTNVPAASRRDRRSSSDRAKSRSWRKARMPVSPSAHDVTDDPATMFEVPDE